MSQLKIRKNVSLAPYTTFRIGGPAKYFLAAKSKEEIFQAIKWAKEHQIPYFILGAGSNLLISDKGFGGLIIKLLTTNYQLLDDNKILTEAGLSLAKLIGISLKNNLTGLEWAVGIPGTVGGAIWGNAGAMNHSISEIIENVEVLVDDKLDQWNNQQCHFDYRSSIFKQEPNLIILTAEFQFRKGKGRISEAVIKRYLAKRKSQPSEPSAGSVFKNPQIADLHQFKHPPDGEAGKFHEYQPISIISGQVPAGWLIEQCGLKGYKIGQAQVSPKHANFIVNLGKAGAEEVMGLINLIKAKVRSKFGIQLEEEIQYLGEGHGFSK